MCLSALFLTCTAAAQARIDSLESVLGSATGKLRAEALYLLCWEYRLTDKDKALRYGEEGLKVGRELKDTAAIGNALNGIAETWLNFGDFDRAEQLTLEQLPYARAIPFPKVLLGALTRLGTIHYRRGQFDEALTYQLEVQREAEKLNKPEIIGVASLNLGLTYMDLKRHGDALHCINTALEAFQKIGFDAGVGACYINLAETLFNQKKYPEAEAAAFKGEEILLKTNNKLHRPYVYTLLGKLYRETGRFAKRLEYQQKALALARENQDEFISSMNMAYLGQTFMESGDMRQSKEYLDSALALAQKIGQKSVTLESYGLLRDWHLLQRQFDVARHYDERLTLGMDSVFNEKMVEKVADARTKYETEKKEAEIKTQRLELFRQRTLIYGLLGGLLALAVLGYLFYNRYRLRKKAELDAAIIREQQLGLNAVIEAQENERKRIAQELHDSIAQEMAAIRMGFSVLQHKLQADAPTEAGRIGELASQLDQSCTQLRSISHTMMPPALETLGLAPSLELLLQNTLQYSDLRYAFEPGEVPEPLAEKVKLGLYRIAQELINNVIKHAGAHSIMVLLNAAGNHLVLRVEDDGKGFDFEQARAKGNMGLLNIISRANALGGAFRVEAAFPKGTLATVRVPLQT